MSKTEYDTVRIEATAEGRLAVWLNGDLVRHVIGVEFSAGDREFPVVKLEFVASIDAGVVVNVVRPEKEE